jgi:prepilin-type N-terminal cleavage/methylation domain-containing protein
MQINNRQTPFSAGFTLIELMTVIAVAGSLMGMVLGIQRYASNKSARSRCTAEVVAMAAAAEAYKTDNAVYPRSDETDALSSASEGGVVDYIDSNLAFYRMISGDVDANGKADVSQGVSNPAPVYMEFKALQLRMIAGSVAYIRDPWDTGSSKSPYGYSTKRLSLIERGNDDASAGRNVSFDLWSAANAPSNPKSWIGNW